MTETLTLQNHNTHQCYGGEITLEDFNTSLPSKKRITNQAKAQNLQSEIENIKRKQDEQKMYSQYTLEELREMKLISNTNGCPTDTLTDKKWQKEFQLRKYFITPYPLTAKKLSKKYSQESGLFNEDAMSTYDGATKWQRYCIYINDVLQNIRSGQSDYCYYIYQIEELLKFHFNDLRTKYHEDNGCGYWEVWLDKREYKY